MLGHGVNRQPWILLAEAALLAIAALCYGFGSSNAAVAAIVLAMGLENAVFQIHGGAGLGLTYVTGALVKVGQLAAVALTGGDRWAGGRTCCCGRRWSWGRCAARLAITGSISPRSGSPPARRWR